MNSNFENKNKLAKYMTGIKNAGTDYQKALWWLRQCENENNKPDIFLYTAVITSHARGYAQTEKSQTIFNEMIEKYHIQPNPVIYGCVYLCVCVCVCMYFVFFQFFFLSSVLILLRKFATKK